MRTFVTQKLTLILFAATLAVSPAAQATLKHEKFLDVVEQNFDRASDTQSKRHIARLYVDMDALKKAESMEKFFQDCMKGSDESQKDYADCMAGNFCPMPTKKVTPVGLAIHTGDAKLLNKFLSPLDTLKDPVLTQWGYRQAYTLANLVMDPSSNNGIPFPSLDKCLDVLDVAVARGLDFSHYIVTGNYYYQPIWAGAHCGWGNPFVEELRIRAFLHGAPHRSTQTRETFDYFIDNKARAILFLLQYLDMVEKGITPKPLDLTQKMVDREAGKNGFTLAQLTEKARRVGSLKALVALRSQELERLSGQNTKKAKARRNHALNLLAEAQHDLVKPNKEMTTIRHKIENRKNVWED